MLIGADIQPDIDSDIRKSDRELLEEVHEMLSELSEVVRRARENPIVRRVTDA